MRAGVSQSAGSCRQASYGTVMSAFARCGDYAGTYKVFMRMLEDGARPNLMHYTAMLTSCARDGDGTTADGVFASMLAAGVQPDVPAYAQGGQDHTGGEFSLTGGVEYIVGPCQETPCLPLGCPGFLGFRGFCCGRRG
ncbi:unnamed protein product, partial [Prorocentrum cordatum]